MDIVPERFPEFLGISLDQVETAAFFGKTFAKQKLFPRPKIENSLFFLTVES